MTIGPLEVATVGLETIGSATAMRHLLPREWQEAEQFGDTVLYLTADELAALGERIRDLLDPYEVRHSDASLRPDGARPVDILRIAFVDREFPEEPEE